MREKILACARAGSTILITGFWISILGWVGALHRPTAAASLQACVPGPHSGMITATQHWCLADSPHRLTGDVIVPAGVMLTVEAGVTVQGADFTALLIEGSLVAEGTAALPITFTSSLDTGGSQWGGIGFDAGSTGSIRYTTVRYAGRRNDVSDAFVPGNPYYVSAVTIIGGELHLENVTLRDVTGDYDHGLLIDDSTVVITDTLVTGIGNGGQQDAAVRVKGPDTVLTMSGCRFTGNTRDRVLLQTGAMMGHDATLSAQPVLEGYELTPDFAVPPTVTLTVEPGVTIMTNKALHQNTVVQGRLEALGTAAQPITFTSATDSGPGEWPGLVFDRGTGHLRYATIRCAGARNHITDEDLGNWARSGIAARGVLTGEVWLEHVTVRDIDTGEQDMGLYIADSNLRVDDSLFTGIGDGSYYVFPDTPMYIAGGNSVVTLTNNTFDANNSNDIVLQAGAMMSRSTSLPAQTGLAGYLLETDFTVPPTVALTVEPGVTVRGGTAGGSAELLVLGHLEATGTPTQPITFTSYLDSAPRQWRGLVLDGSAGFGTGTLRYATVRYGGSDNSVLDGSFSGYHEGANVTVYNVQAGEVSLEHVTLESTGNSYGDHGLYVNNGRTSVVSTTISNNCDGDSYDSGVYVAGQSSVLIDDSVIETNSAAGLIVEGDDAFVSVTRSRIVGNEGDGVRNTGEASVILSGDPAKGNVIAYNQDYGANQAGLAGQILAAYNYWGDPSGPTHAGNPGGLGEPVTDRVLYDPWLTEVPVGTPPASGVVLTFGPSVVSAGDTINVGFLVPNVTSEVFRDAVLVAQLPEEAEFVLSWPAGAYWPDRHQVVWKLGDLYPGGEAAFGVQVRYLWGLQPHQMTYLTGLLVAENLPSDLLNLDEYLAYEAVTVTSFDELTEQELTALLAAEPDLKALFDDAERQGFSYYGAARLEQLSDGTEQVSLPMLKRTSPGEQIFVQHVLSGTYRVHRLPSSAIVDTPVASFTYDYQIKWVEMLRSSLGQSALIFDIGRTACVGSGCDNFSFFDCLRNCLIANVPAHQFSPSYSQACFECYKAGGDACSTCAAHMEDYRNDSLQRSTQRCQDHCSDDSSWGKCDNDTPTRECKTSSIVMVTPCDDCRFQPEEMTYESCHAGERCILGVCTPIKPPRTHPIEVLVAGDPNAMEGPMEAAPGQVVSYTIAYENVGEGTAYGVFIEAELPDPFDPSSLVLHDGGVTFAQSRTLLWSVGTLAAGAGGEVGFDVQVPTETVSGTAIIANATVYFPSVPETTPTNDVITRVGDVVAHSQNVATDEGVPVPISLTGHTPTGGSLQFEVVREPLNGALSGSLPNLTYTPADGFEGPDRLSFRVADTLNTSLPAEVAIKVNTGAEAVAPEVLFTVPGDGATDVSVYATLLMVDTYHPTIWAQFTEPLDPTTVTAASFTVADHEGGLLSGTVEYDGTANVARLVPSEPLVEGQTYAATLTTAVRDTSGNPMAANYVWHFRTEAQWVYLPLVVRGN